MGTNVVELMPDAPQAANGEVDTSLVNTTKAAIKLGYRIGSLFLSQAVGLELPGVRNRDVEPGPKRHVELEPDQKVTVETRDGSEHIIDIYGLEFFHEETEPKLAPLVMIMPLALPHDRGFQAPVIDAVQRHAREQHRPVLVISSEGFGEKPLPAKALFKLDFEKMTDNLHEALDILEHRMYIEIPSIVTTGASRGGTLSLMMGSRQTSERRTEKGRKPRSVEGAISIAPAGLRPLDSLEKRLKVLRQFAFYEPSHVIRKASDLDPEDLLDYGHTLVESVSPRRALPAIGWTALQYAIKTPLKDIGRSTPEDEIVWILVMANDGITTPKYWKQEFGHLEQAYVVTLAGHHLSIDSITKVAGAINEHLDQNFASALVSTQLSRAPLWYPSDQPLAQTEDL